MRRSKALFIAGLVSVVHYLIGMGCLILGVSLGMREFDSPTQSQTNDILVKISEIIFFPLWTASRNREFRNFMDEMLPGLWGQVPFLLISLAWGLGITSAMVYFNKRKNRTEG